MLRRATATAAAATALLLLVGAASAAAGVNRTVWAGDFTHVYDPTRWEAQPNASKDVTYTWYVNDHTFVYGPGQQWHIFGITHTDPADPEQETNTAHAVGNPAGAVNTSLQPTRDAGYRHAPFALGALPPETHIWAPYVFRLANGTFIMVYCGGGWNRDKSRISLARSDDLWRWTRVRVLFEGGVDGRDPMVVELNPPPLSASSSASTPARANASDDDGNHTAAAGGPRWVIYYTGTTPDNASVNNVSHVQFARTSGDLLEWSDPVTSFDGGYTGQNYGGPTESPFVIRRGPRSFYLFSGAWYGSYVITHVFHSSDPMDFGSVVTGTANHVGTITAHAPEVIRDANGQWYISGAGWGLRGVYMAPLFFADGEGDFPQPSWPAVPPAQPAQPGAFATNWQLPFSFATANGTDTGSTPPNGTDVFDTPSGLAIGNALETAVMRSAGMLPSAAGKNSKNGSATCQAEVTLITKDGNPTPASPAAFNTTLTLLPFGNFGTEFPQAIAVHVGFDSHHDGDSPPAGQLWLTVNGARRGLAVPWMTQSEPFHLAVSVDYGSGAVVANVRPPRGSAYQAVTGTVDFALPGHPTLALRHGSALVNRLFCDEVLR